MASCPNINSQEWKSLVSSVGEFEAYRDFFEYETIRSVNDVAKKLVDDFKLTPNQYQSIIKNNQIVKEANLRYILKNNNIYISKIEGKGNTISNIIEESIESLDNYSDINPDVSREETITKINEFKNGNLDARWYITSYLTKIFIERLLGNNNPLSAAFSKNYRFREIANIPNSKIIITTDNLKSNPFYQYKNYIVIGLKQLNNIVDDEMSIEQYESLIKALADEEAIHLIAEKVTTKEDINTIYKELSKSDIVKIKNIYNNDSISKENIVHEYLRMVVQHKLFNTTTEIEIKNITETVKKILKKVIDTIVSFITRNHGIFTQRIIDDIIAFTKNEISPELAEKLKNKVYDNNVLGAKVSPKLSDIGSQDLEVRNKYFIDGDVQSSSNILKKISNSKHPLNQVAQRLYKYVDANNVNIHLVSHQELNDKYPTKMDSAGIYDQHNNVIYIAEDVNFRGNGSEPTILHEVIHALSYHLLKQDNANTRHFKDLYNYIKTALPNEYATTDIDEFIAGIFTDGEFIQKLLDIPSTGRNFKRVVIDLYESILALFGITKSESIYQEAFSVASLILDTNFLKLNRDEIVYGSKPNVNYKRTYKEVLEIYEANKVYKTHSEKEALDQYKNFTEKYPEIHTYAPFIEKGVYKVAMKKPIPFYTTSDVQNTDDVLGNPSQLLNVPVIDTEDIITAEGTKGAASYNKKENVIKVNRTFLKQKFIEKAWTKPRKLIEILHDENIESYAQALPENQFNSYDEWEQFVINHEYQHSLYSRTDFNNEFPEKTKGDYESEINNRALNQLKSNISISEVKKEASQAYAIESIRKMTDIFSDATGVEYEIIDEPTAKDLTKESSNPWNGEVAFFFNGKVYFITDKLTSQIAFHEFSHPVIKALVKSNKELADALFNQLMDTVDGKSLLQHILDINPNLSNNREGLIEEVLVSAMTDIYERKESTPEYQSFIKELLYRIKSFIRKLFGTNADVSKLDINTTLEDLVDMLSKGDKFKLDEDTISDKDVVMYYNSRKKDIDEVVGFNQEALDDLVSKGYRKAINHIKMVESSRNYNDMLDLLVNDFDRGYLQQIRNDLGNYSAIIDKKIEQKISDIEYTYEKSKALVNTLYTLDTMVDKIAKHLIDLSVNVDDPGILHKIDAYSNFINSWKEFIQDGFNALDEVGMTPDSIVSGILSKVKRNMEKADNTIRKIQGEAMSLVLQSELSLQGKMVKEKYDNIIKSLEEKGAPAKQVEQWFIEYYGMTKKENDRYEQLKASDEKTPLKGDNKKELNNLRLKSLTGVAVSKEKIEAALKGELFDASYSNSFIEGYMYNTDPIIGGFAKFIKNNITDVITTAQEKTNGFIKDISKDLKDAGYNPYRISSLAEKITEVEEIGYEDEKTGELKFKKIRVFKNLFKNWRKDIDTLTYNIKLADKEYEENKNDDTKEKLKIARKNLDIHKKTYFHDRFVTSYYEADKILEKDDIGLEAKYRQEEIIKQINELTEDNDKESERLHSSSQVQRLWREYRQLRSIYNKNGTLKTNTNTLSDGTVINTYDYDIAIRLQEHHTKKKDFYEYKTIPGLFQDRLQDYIQELININSDVNSQGFQDSVNEWIETNSRIVVKKEYYEARDVLIKRLTELTKRTKDSSFTVEETNEAGQTVTKTYNIGDLYKKLVDLVRVYRDDDGQLIGTEMSKELIKKTKEIEEQIIELKQLMPSNSGLSPKEFDEMVFLQGLNKAGQLPYQDRKRLYELLDKRENQGTPKRITDEIKSIMKELGDMQEKLPTEYYLETVNEWLGKLDTKVLEGITNAGYIGPNTANTFLSDVVVNDLLRQSKEFKTWFMANHIRKKQFNAEIGEKIDVWERIHVWSVTKPRDEKYLESTEIKDQFGKTKVIYKVPSIDFSVRKVKDEFKTPRILGETITNNGEWLPRKNVVNSPYINEDYLRLSESTDSKDKALFSVLEKMKDYHLKNQEGLPKHSKLYLDVPRYRQSGLETAQQVTPSESLKQATVGELPLLTTILKRVRDFWKKAKDNPDSGYNYDDDFLLARIDLMQSDKERIPISGVYDLDLELCSTDLTQVLTDYMAASERQKKLIQMMPVANALKNVVDNPTSKTQMVNRGLFSWKKKKDKSVRQMVVKNIIEREFYGKQNTGMLSDTPWANNTMKLLFKRASMGFFALNYPSALKNWIGPKVQAMIESVGGKHFNAQYLAQAEASSFETMFKITATIYSGEPRPLEVQKADIFNAIQDRTLEKLGEGVSRTALHDTFNLSWLYNFRKWTEMQSSLQIFEAMLKAKKIPYGEQEISYFDAWELINNQITLKKGVDVRYDRLPTNLIIRDNDTIDTIASRLFIPKNEMVNVITESQLENIKKDIKAVEKKKESELNEATDSEKEKINTKYNKQLEFTKTFKIDNIYFKHHVNTMHTVQNDLQGAYASFDQPELQRYILFRFVMFLKRFFTPMFMKRVGFTSANGQTRGRINYATGDVREGYYVTFLKVMGRMFTNPKYMMYMNKDEKASIGKTMLEFGAMYMITLFLLPFLGYDPDDKERYKKMRERSGSMLDDDYNTLGFLHNHLILLATQVRNENEQFLPIPGYGLDDYVSLMSVKSISTGPTLEVYSKMLGSLVDIVSDSPSAKYRKTVGPYPWQEKDAYKIWNYTFKSFGVTGSNISPQQALMNLEGFKTRR